MTDPQSHPASCSRGELGLAALAFALLVAGFLARPIVHLDSAHFSTAELLNELPLTRVDPAHWVRDRLSSDPVVEFLPWIQFAGSELAHGRVPLWNPYNACGAPLLGNHQSAVFSPFTLPYYVLSTKLALLLSAFAKLWCAAFFSYGFLRRLGIAALSSFAGASAFAFCGHNAVLLQWPHPGVIAWLPASLWCVEAILAELEQPSGRRTLRAHVLLALVLALEAYSGHPETLAVSAATLALWTSVRLAWMRAPVGTARCVRAGACLVLTGVLAFGLAAPQLFPFLEYLTHSAALHARERAGAIALDTSTWPRHFFPNFLGTNLSGKELAEGLPPPNYQVATAGYVGALVLVLAVFGLQKSGRDGRWCAFAAIAVLAPIWSHDLFGVASALAAHGWPTALPAYVAQVPWEFAVACLAARGLDQLGRARSRRRAIAVAVLGAAMLALFGTFAVRMSNEHIAALHASAVAAHAIYVHLVFIASTFALGIAAASALALARSSMRADVLVAVASACILAQTAALFAPYHSITEDEFFFPRTDSMRTLQTTCGSARLTMLGMQGLPPSVNLVYGLDETPSCDALRVFEVDRLYVRLHRPYDDWYFAQRTSAKAMKLFGSEYLLFARNAGSRAPPRFEGSFDELQLVAPLEGFDLYRLRGSRGRFWFVERASPAATSDEAFERVTRPEFDPYASVVLGPDPDGVALPFDAGANAQGDGSIAVLDEHPGSLRLRVERGARSFLVLALARFPGWSARIDGSERPLLRANYAFQALDVPSGAHEIELVYQPASWRSGLYVGLASALALVSLAWFARRRSARTSLASAPARQ